MNLKPSPRLDDWEPRLLDYVRSIAHTPMVWGQHDCLIFVLSAVDAMTGSGLASLIKGRYADPDGAWEVCRSFGYRSHVHYLARNFNTRASKFQIMRGDIVAFPTAHKEIGLGICQGSCSYVLTADKLGVIPNQMVRKGFEV